MFVTPYSLWRNHGIKSSECSARKMQAYYYFLFTVRNRDPERLSFLSKITQLIHDGFKPSACGSRAHCHHWSKLLPFSKGLWLLLWTVIISHSNKADDVMAFLSLITGPAPSSNYCESAFWKVIYSWMRGKVAMLGPCTSKWRESVRMDSKLSYSIVILFNTISFRTSLFGPVEARSMYTLLPGYLCSSHLRI